MTQAEIEIIEGLIDTRGTHNILEAIRKVCDAKADHVRENWQDEALARSWELQGEFFQETEHELCKKFSSIIT